MCTALFMKDMGGFFGRTLDLEYRYCEQVVVTPRKFPFGWKHAGETADHAALIGIATVAQDYPLYYDAVNEHGVAMAGLNFPHSARYSEQMAEGRINLAPFEFIPWVLTQAKTAQEALELIRSVNLLSEPFGAGFPCAPLHWMLADSSGAWVVECTADGLRIYDDPVGVMTNEPAFPQQMHHLARYMHLTPKPPVNLFSDALDLRPDCTGMGAIGLPGDWSSPSRFVRIAFVRENAATAADPLDAVTQFFHTIGCVDVPRGADLSHDGRPVVSVYTSCAALSTATYYYHTHTNRCLTAVPLRDHDLDAAALTAHTLNEKQIIVHA